MLENGMGTAIGPHRHQSLQKVLPIINVNPNSMNVYHWQFLKTEAGVLFYTVVGNGFERQCWQILFCHWWHSNSCITVKRDFISAFLFSPVLSPTPFVSILCETPMISASIPAGFQWNPQGFCPITIQLSLDVYKVARWLCSHTSECRHTEPTNGQCVWVPVLPDTECTSAAQKSDCWQYALHQLLQDYQRESHHRQLTDIDCQQTHQHNKLFNLQIHIHSTIV